MEKHFVENKYSWGSSYFKGRKYDGCTRAHSVNGKPWCAIQVLSSLKSLIKYSHHHNHDVIASIGNIQHSMDCTGINCWGCTALVRLSARVYNRLVFLINIMNTIIHLTSITQHCHLWISFTSSHQPTNQSMRPNPHIWRYRCPLANGGSALGICTNYCGSSRPQTNKKVTRACCRWALQNVSGLRLLLRWLLPQVWRLLSRTTGRKTDVMIKVVILNLAPGGLPGHLPTFRLGHCCLWPSQLGHRPYWGNFVHTDGNCSVCIFLAS